MTLNQRALKITQTLLTLAKDYKVQVQKSAAGATIIDLGIGAAGGLQAGLALARVCLAGLAEVSITPGVTTGCPQVQVHTDHPVEACLGSQYAGWQIAVDKYFAMGSGPMRRVAKREKLITELGQEETTDHVIGVLEASQLPTDEVIQEIADKCQLSVDRVSLLVAPTNSLAGTVQIVARSVETCLHKLHELKFDVKQVMSGYGTAPLPPIARKTVSAIGRTNDAILYGGEVTLWVRTTDELLQEIGPKVPSSASKDYGLPFAQLFERVGGDFYKLDPHLFSPAKVTFLNLSTGRAFTYGRIVPHLLRQSFFEGGS